MTPLPPAVLAKLLHMANAAPPADEALRSWFYELKEELLNLFGFPCGDELQRIEAKCWDCGGDGQSYFHNDDCGRCGGTGVWEVKYFRLIRWRWGAFVFHRPVCRVFNRDKSEVTHNGVLKHRDYRNGEPIVARAVLASLFRRGSKFAGEVCRQNTLGMQTRINGALYELGLYRHCGDRRHLITAMREVHGTYRDLRTRAS